VVAFFQCSAHSLRGFSFTGLPFSETSNFCRCRCKLSVNPIFFPDALLHQPYANSWSILLAARPIAPPPPLTSISRAVCAGPPAISQRKLRTECDPVGILIAVFFSSPVCLHNLHAPPSPPSSSSATMRGKRRPAFPLPISERWRDDVCGSIRIDRQVHVRTQTALWSWHPRGPAFCR